MSKLDDVSWHERTDEPQIKANHIPLYWYWLLTRGHLSPRGKEPTEVVLATGWDQTMESVYRAFDDAGGGKLVDDDLTAEARAFTALYYADHWLSDLESIIPGGLDALSRNEVEPDLLPDTAAMIDQRFAEWQRGELKPRPRPTGCLFGLLDRCFGLGGR